MAKTRQSNPDETIRYLVLSHKGDFVIEVPATWRTTFAAVNPAGHPGRDGHCLRLYEGEKLRAVFGDVTGFRDMAIPLARKVSKETGSAEWTHDSTGNFKRTAKRKVDTELIAEASEVQFPDEF